MRIVRHSGKYLIALEITPDEAEAMADGLGQTTTEPEELRRLAKLARTYQADEEHH